MKKRCLKRFPISDNIIERLLLDLKDFWRDLCEQYGVSAKLIIIRYDESGKGSIGALHSEFGETKIVCRMTRLIQEINKYHCFKNYKQLLKHWSLGLQHEMGHYLTFKDLSGEQKKDLFKLSDRSLKYYNRRRYRKIKFKIKCYYSMPVESLANEIVNLTLEELTNSYIRGKRYSNGKRNKHISNYRLRKRKSS